MFTPVLSVFPRVELCVPVPENIGIETGNAWKLPGFARVWLLNLSGFHSTCTQQPHSSLISSSKGSEILFLESQKGVGIVNLVRGSGRAEFSELRTWSSGDPPSWLLMIHLHESSSSSQDGYLLSSRRYYFSKLLFRCWRFQATSLFLPSREHCSGLRQHPCREWVEQDLAFYSDPFNVILSWLGLDSQ